MVTFALVQAGLAAIAAGSARHGPAILGRPQAPRVAASWRLGGWALLLLSLIAATDGPAWRIGLVAWFGLLAAAALAVTLMITIRPRILHVFALLLLAAAVLRVLIHI